MEHIEPKQAYELLRAHPDALFVDCRSETEYLFVGHPVGAEHVAWQDGPEWAVNPEFVSQVARLAGGRERTVVLICRNGNRSEAAGRALEQAGFSRVYNVVHGFEGPLDAQHHRNTLAGWRHDGLPWQQS
ncbi:MAG TPA: rhodanese-like domain-containing protein [Burkholderiales bacterium]|nr:rhodanese-like domain-containing protein [Burkholderiales bacterium]